MTTLETLLERVKSATGPDRELDAAIELALGAAPRRLGAGPAMRPQCPPFSFSIDAALALVERVLPGWQYRLDQYQDHYDCNLAHWDTEDRIYVDDVDGTGATMPLAIIAACLSALIQERDEAWAARNENAKLKGQRDAALAANAALMSERASLIETKREQLASQQALIDTQARKIEELANRIVRLENGYEAAHRRAQQAEAILSRHKGGLQDG